ncbi:MAG: hypothetical protein ACR2OU_08200 [Thermomicrobiales bacterium]
MPTITAGAAAPAAAANGQAPTAAQDGNAGHASIDLQVLGCNPTADDAATVSQRSYDDLVAACTKPVADVTVHLTATATGADSPQTSESSGKISFSDLAAGTYTAYSDIPRGTAYEIVYCSADGGAPYQKSFNDAIVTTFADLQTEQIVCSWFVVPVAAEQASLPTDSPSATAPASDLASLQVNVLTCPDGTDLSPETSYTDLSQNCTDPAANVTLHLSNVDHGSDIPQTTGKDGRATWADLQPGTYTAYSDSDRTAATEVLYCAASGGDPYQKSFNDAIVTTFENVTTEHLACSWFEIPVASTPTETQSPVATASSTATAQPTEPMQAAAQVAAVGASLTVHLASCPANYTGTDFYADCHGNGIADIEFVLSGPDGDQQQTTTIPETPGPGVVDFTGLAAGDYTLAGGPPGDFGKVELYCSLQPGGDQIDSPVDSTRASLSIGGSDTVLCDWYYIPEDQSGITPTPSPSPTVVPTLTPTTVVPTATATTAPTPESRAEFLVTLRSCPPLASGYGGATHEQLQQSCTQLVNDVPFSLGDVQAPPLSANTGVSGDGAVRFYDLLPANYTLTPTLAGNLTSLAVFCTVDSGAPYQKALQNGTVTFVDVKADAITCDWYAVQAAAPTATVVPGVTPTAAPTQTSGPSGSITVREYLCAKDKASIQDWERECKAGSSGAAFTLKSSDGGVEDHGSTDKTGVLVFKGLADGHYALNQDKGSWCRATADRVDSQSRVIVGDGGNTDVVLYQCNQVTSLPDTGTGTPISRNNGNGSYSAMMLTAIGLALLAGSISLITFVRTRRSQRHESEHREMAARPVATDSGRTRMRFK